MLNKWSFSLVALLSAFSLSLQATNACTEILLNKSKGVVVSGRTLDYDCEMGSKICFKAKGTRMIDACAKYTDLTGTPFSWTAKYSAVLVDGFDEPAYIDGMNTEGLSVGTLWDSDSQPASANRIEAGRHGVSNVTLTEYILENASNIQEARQLISGLTLVISTYKGKPMPVHWVITERSGKSMVMELRNGRPNFFDQSTQVGVMTNSPTYDLQLSNLEASKKAMNADPAYTLPGDYRSTSRFVKSAFLVAHVPEFTAVDDAVVAATQVLHNVETPKGAQGPTGSYTQWIAVRDQTNLRYLLMGVKHSATKVVNLSTANFKELENKRISLDTPAGGDVSALVDRPAQYASTLSHNN